MALPAARWKVFLLLVGIWAGIFLPGLGIPGLKGEEHTRILPAIHMLDSGDWVVPHIGGEPYYNKPPLVNWIIAASFTVCGERTEFAARLPSPLSVLAFLALLFWMRSGWLDDRGKVIAAIVYMTNVSVAEKGRLIEIEALYIAITGLATVWWLNVWSLRGSRWSLWLVPAFFLGLGLLLKGPVILLFFYLPVVAVAVAERRVRELFAPQHLLALVLMAGMFAAWAWPMAERSPPSEMTGTWFEQMVMRLLPERIQFGRWMKIIWKSFRNFLPWLVLVPLLWRRDWVGNVPGRAAALFRGGRFGLMAAFLLIVLMPATEPRYTLPLIPLFAVLLGLVLGSRVEATPFDRFWRNAALVLGAAIALTAVGVLVYRPGLGAAGAAALTVGIAALLIKHRSRLIGTLHLSLATGAVFAAAFLLFSVAPFGAARMAQYEKASPIVTAVHEHVPEGEEIGVYHPGGKKFLFYLRRPIRYVLSPEEAGGVTWLVTDVVHLDEFPNAEVIEEMDHQRLREDFALLKLR